MSTLVERYYQKITESIAFYPTVIAVGFAIMSFLVIYLQSSEAGAWLMERVPVLEFRDLSTARTILGALVGGVMGLTVFSFSMVMVVLNQAAANLTPKILDGLTRERAYQRVLGVYVGTTVYCLLLLINVERSAEETGRMPSIGVFLAVAFGILCVALFVYFIHHVSEAVKPRSIIRRVRTETEEALQQAEGAESVPPEEIRRALDGVSWHPCCTARSGYFQDVPEDVVELASERDVLVRFHRRRGEHVPRGAPLFAVSGAHPPDDEVVTRIDESLVFYDGEQVADNWYYGFRQLREVAVKALSPGINDPGTAVLAIEALTELLIRLLRCDTERSRVDEHGNLRVLLEPYEPGDVLRLCIAPIRHYGRGDASVMRALIHMVENVAASLPDEPDTSQLLHEQALDIVLECRASLRHPSDKAAVEEELTKLRRMGGAFSNLPAICA